MSDSHQYFAGGHRHTFGPSLIDTDIPVVSSLYLGDGSTVRLERHLGTVVPHLKSSGAGLVIMDKVVASVAMAQGVAWDAHTSSFT